MFTHIHTFRVRYNETDQMGIVNNAQYATYFEIGRTEMFRHLGLDYGQIERQGLMMPVNELHVKYHLPAYYDDLLTITTAVRHFPSSRIRFDYQIHNTQQQLLTEGYTVLAFLNATTRRPIRVPASIAGVLRPFFKHEHDTDREI